jgi:hypothetical protein
VTAHSNVKVDKQRSSFIKTGKNYTGDSEHKNNMHTARDPVKDAQLDACG